MKKISLIITCSLLAFFMFSCGSGDKTDQKKTESVAVPDSIATDNNTDAIDAQESENAEGDVKPLSLKLKSEQGGIWNNYLEVIDGTYNLTQKREDRGGYGGNSKIVYSNVIKIKLKKTKDLNCSNGTYGSFKLRTFDENKNRILANLEWSIFDISMAEMGEIVSSTPLNGTISIEFEKLLKDGDPNIEEIKNIKYFEIVTDGKCE